MNEIMPDKLKLVLSSHRVGAALIAVLNRPSGNVFTTTIDELKTNPVDKDVTFSRYEIIQLFKGLAAIGCGNLRKGRRGHPSRFIWATEARELSRAALSDTEHRLSGVQDGPKATTDISGSSGSAAVAKVPTLTHQFNLRADFIVTLILPADVTQNEAQRLQQFVAALPMASAQPPVQ
jgi:hypothetical protein